MWAPPPCAAWSIERRAAAVGRASTPPTHTRFPTLTARSLSLSLARARALSTPSPRFQASVWDLLYGNLDEASLAEHGVGIGAAGFSATGKNHPVADPSRYPYSAVAALLAYAETGRGSGGRGGGGGTGGPAPLLTCTAVLISPRHALTAASCVSRPTFELTWRADAPKGGASPSGWADFEVVPGLFGTCSRNGTAAVAGVRIAPEWEAWDTAFANGTASSDGASNAARARAGSTVDFNYALLTLDRPLGDAAGFFALGSGLPGSALPKPGTNLSRLAYGGPSIEANMPTFSMCPLLDDVGPIDDAAPPALVAGCAMYPGTRGAPLWIPPKLGGPRSVLALQTASMDYWHAYVALSPSEAAAHLATVNATLAASEPAAQGLATAIDGAAIARLTGWMAEDGVGPTDLARAGAPKGLRSADPRPPLLGGGETAAAGQAAAVVAVGAGDQAARAPSLAALDAADQARRVDRTPGAASGRPGAATVALTALPDVCTAPAGHVAGAAPADGTEAKLTADAGLGDPPLYGRHVPLPQRFRGTFPYSAIGALRAYANASDADAAAAAGVPATGGPPRPPAPRAQKNCASALVGPRHVLTAHHCVFNTTGRRNRDAVTFVFFPAAGAGCGGSPGSKSPGAPLRVKSLRALPQFEGCLQDLAGDPAKALERAAKSDCDALLGLDYALLELDGAPGDDLGFFALGPPARAVAAGAAAAAKGGAALPPSPALAGLPAVNSTVTVAGFGGALANGTKILSLSRCTVLPSDTLALAREAVGVAPGNATAAATKAAGPATRSARWSGAGDPAVPGAVEDPMAGRHVLFTGCEVAVGDSGGPLWQEYAGASPGAATGRRHLVGVQSTLQAVWAAASRLDPGDASGWVGAFTATYGTSDPLQASAVAIDGTTAAQLVRWMADDGVPAARLAARGGLPPDPKAPPTPRPPEEVQLLTKGAKPAPPEVARPPALASAPAPAPAATPAPTPPAPAPAPAAAAAGSAPPAPAPPDTPTPNALGLLPPGGVAALGGQEEPKVAAASAASAAAAPAPAPPPSPA